MRHVALTFGLLLAAGPIFAAGSSSSNPPQPTATTTECAEGLVWDKDEKACVAPKESNLDDDALYDAVRELAYAGRVDGATAALDAMSDQNDDRVLTYRGFLARVSGDWDVAQDFYVKAIAANPNNLLARSYYGQGLVSKGDFYSARAELSEIRRRGGRDTWAEASLRLALDTGSGPAY